MIEQTQKTPTVTLPRPMFLTLCKPPARRRSWRAKAIDAAAIASLIAITFTWCVIIGTILANLINMGVRP